MADENLRDRILKSPEGRKMLEMVSPIYDRSYTGLWLFEVIGREYDQLAELTESLKQQITPQTATWSIDFWEREYGVTPDPAKALAKRQALLLSKIQTRGAFTPAKLKELAEAVTGMGARVDERAGPYTFAVYLSAITADKQALTDEISRIKPAHMSFELHFEQSASTMIYWGMASSYTVQFAIRQVNG